MYPATWTPGAEILKNAGDTDSKITGQVNKGVPPATGNTAGPDAASTNRM